MSSTLAKVTIGEQARGDAFFRYQRDVTQVKYEAKHGGQTRITNLDMICLQLHVDSKHLCKALQKHLGCTRISSKSGAHIIRQHVTIEQIEAGIETYIKRNVLCKKCTLPELDDCGNCKACGYTARAKVKTSNPDVDDACSDVEDVPGLAELMRELFDARDEAHKSKSDAAPIDCLIDACWECNDKSTLDALHARWQATRSK